MFDGDKQCCLCSNEMKIEERRFGLTLTGYSRVFCSSCFQNRKDEVMRVLHELDNKRPG